MSCRPTSRYPFSPPYYANSEFAMTDVNLQQTFKYIYTLNQICHCEKQRDDAIWSVLTGLLRYARNDRTVGWRLLRYARNDRIGYQK